MSTQALGVSRHASLAAARRRASRSATAFSSVRLSLARFLVLGLEFQLAADVLRTAISPTFAEIGKLAAIAAIRTVLNYFLNREISQEQQEIEALTQSRPAPPP